MSAIAGGSSKEAQPGRNIQKHSVRKLLSVHVRTVLFTKLRMTPCRMLYVAKCHLLLDTTPHFHNIIENVMFLHNSSNQEHRRGPLCSPLIAKGLADFYTISSPKSNLSNFEKDIPVIIVPVLLSVNHRHCRLTN